MEDGESPHSLYELQGEIRRMMEELARKELDNMVQVQIACELLNGRRTTTELVEALFGLNQGNPGYTTHGELILEQTYGGPGDDKIGDSHLITQ